MVWLTQLLFYGLPWLNWNDRQAVLFDLDARRFYLFKLALYPQDFIYLALLLVICALGLFFVTAVAGRVWCGFSCPQTVYTAIYLWVERRFEGDRSARMRLDAAPWTATKLARKAGKQAAWIAIGLWTGFTFVGYFTPIQTLGGLVLSLDTGPWETFWIGFYGLATYGNAGYLREQVCKHMCPYGRFQSVMFDRDTLIIGYDSARGEPRGSRSRASDAQAAGLGDCINCTMCVQVCPTGIDIRDGLQSDCIGCAACIDACDEVMDKVKLPRGLIRYSTEHALARHYSGRDIVAHLLRPRTLIYAAILLLLVGATLWSLATRLPLKVDVIRDRATLYREADDEQIENVFQLHVMNTDEQARRYAVAVAGIDGIKIIGETTLEVPAASNRNFVVVASVKDGTAPKGSNKIVFDVRALENDRIAVQEKSTFYMP